MEGFLEQGEFTSLEFGRRELRQMASIYHVYHSAHEYKEIEADSAYEAMTRSEIAKPFKISRYAVRNLNVLRCGMLADSVGFEEAPAAPTVSVEVEEQPQPSASAE